MRALYDRMAELPPLLQMFMQGCSPALEARRHRIACREVVTRTLLAMSCGVDLALWWNLAPEVPNFRDRFNLTGFVSDKLALMGFVHGELTRREPAADAVERLTGYLDGAKSVCRLESEAGLVVIEIERDIGPVLVMWIEADAFTGEDEPPRLIMWPWSGATAHVVDVFGSSRDVATVDRQLSLGVGVTPLFIS
jgi:hypothetical protein